MPVFIALKKPVIERNVNKTREVMSGTTVELICEVDGAPTPDILWFKVAQLFYLF